MKYATAKNEIFSLGIEFNGQAAMLAFSSRLEYVRSLLTPTGQWNHDNNKLLTALLSLVERSVSPSLPGVSRVPSDPLAGITRNPSGHQAGSAKASASISGCNQSFNSNAGKHCCISFSDVWVSTEMMHISSVGIYT